MASAKEVSCKAVQVADGDEAFLLMAEATVATTTALLLLLGMGTTTIIPGLLLPRQHPG